MNDYVGKVCPFCKTEIKPEDEVKVCPACETPHHLGCWQENRGCTTFGCSEQHYEPQGTNISDVCAKCGTPLGDGQEFCPKCGTRKGLPPANVCGKCEAQLQDGQEFCPKCGQKVGLAVDSSVVSKIGQFNQGVTKKKNKKPLIFGLIGAAAVVVILIVMIALGGGTADFNKLFPEYTGENWCTIAKDGSYMEVDTNSLDMDDYTYTEAYYAIEDINEKLGFSSATFKKMGQTCSLDGRLTESNDKYTVSWTYHPNRGMEVLYEKKK